tara:strand:+ start:281 stop:2281 length:2001 start_codon:yes stop_codon:yes gene_type:complete
MSTIKISELATNAISLTDFFAKADSAGLANKNTVQGLSNFLNTVGTLAFRGVLLAADAAVRLDGVYVAGDAGTYTNNGGLVITVSNQIVLISITGTQTVFEKAEFPLSITIDAVPTDTSVNAVQSNGVFDALKLNENNIISRVNSLLSNSVAFTGNTDSPTNYTFLDSRPILTDQYLSDLKINGLAGTVSVLIVNAQRDTILFEKELTIVDGINNFTDINLLAKKGNFLGIYLNTGKVKYTSGTNSSYSYSGKLVGSESLAISRDIDFSFNLKEFNIVEKLLNNKVIPPNTSSFVTESQEDLGTWDNTGFTLVDGFYKSTTDGQMMTSTKMYGITNRQVEIIFEPSTGSGKFAFATLFRETATINAGSAVRVDLNNNTVNILTAYQGSLGSALISYTPSFTMVADKKYKLLVELKGREIGVKIAEENTTLGYKLFNDFEDFGYYFVSSYGYSTFSTSSSGYLAGTMQGSLRIINELGNVEVFSLKHEILGSLSPYIYVAGDSITEGFSVDDNSKFGGLLKDYYGNKDVVVSGIGGARSAYAFDRIQQELLIMRPRIFIPYFGSNSETTTVFEAGMTALIELAQSIGSTVYLCTIPTQAALSTSINTLATTFNLEVIDFKNVLTSGGTPVVDFYTNIDFNGNTYNDGLHPNPLGHIKMFGEILRIIK